MSTTVDLITAQLHVLAPQQLHIEDDSHLHAGHAGNTGGGHYSVFIVSDAFEGLSLLKRHQLIYDKLSSLMQSHIHALSIQAKAPDEISTS